MINFHRSYTSYCSFAEFDIVFVSHLNLCELYIMGILRITGFSAKILVTGGALYYTHQYGIWGNTQETEEGYARLKSQIQVNVLCLNILGNPSISGQLGVPIPKQNRTNFSFNVSFNLE